MSYKLYTQCNFAPQNFCNANILQLKAFPDWPVSSKPTEVRMGKGKGAIDFWSCKVKPGSTIFEISGADRFLAIEALKSGASKLPVQVKIVG